MSCVDESPALNAKCIVFTLLLAGGYWYLPKKNKWILLALLYFPYLVLAWYDYKYQCQRNLGPTYLANYYDILKPQDSEQIIKYKNWCPKWKNLVLVIDIIVLLVLLALTPAFLRWKPN